MSRRLVVLDTETTGLEPEQGHRIIEIGCVELVDRRFTHNSFHYYLNPEREVDAGAVDVHGLTNEFLRDKPLFAEICQPFLDYLGDADLVIHNAAFDVGFINHEFAALGLDLRIEERCGIEDSLQLARRLHPGQKNSLDALCKRYGIDNSQRTLHGALLDAEILADVYLAMTGGQTSLNLEFDAAPASATGTAAGGRSVSRSRVHPVTLAEEDKQAHRRWLEMLGEGRVWAD